MGKSGCCRNVSDRSSRELVTDLDCIRVDKCRRVIKVDNSHFSLLFSVIFSSLDIFVRARKRPSLDARLITPARRFISISRVAHTTFFFKLVINLETVCWKPTSCTPLFRQFRLRWLMVLCHLGEIMHVKESVCLTQDCLGFERETSSELMSGN